MKERGLETAKSSPVPGSKEDVKKTAMPTNVVKASAGTIARKMVNEVMSIDRALDAIHEARESAGDVDWDAMFDCEVHDDQEFDPVLGKEEARLYRGVGAIELHRPRQARHWLRGEGGGP